VSQSEQGGYFDWLTGLVRTSRSRNPRNTYWELLHILHTTPFTWYVRNDDNRGEDGKELRVKFQERFGYVELDQPDADASMLEMLVALAEVASYESLGTPPQWFWKLIENLDLINYTDANFSDFAVDEVTEVLRNVNSRRYGSDGRGGLFPLRYTNKDQRRVELWYQLAEYLQECEDSNSWPYLR